MASSLDYLTYVLDLLREVPNISYKKMMGEYILYKDGIIFGGIYDNRFLIKKSKATSELALKEAIPYPGGSTMFLLDIENPHEIKLIINELTLDLKKS